MDSNENPPNAPTLSKAPLPSESVGVHNSENGKTTPEGTTTEGTTPEGTTPEGTTPEGTTPLPLYTQGDEEQTRGREPSLKIADQNLVTSTAHPIPKDMSEGLPNPVFSNDPNSERGGYHPSIICRRIKNDNNRSLSSAGPPLIQSFNSLASFEQYASKTALYKNSTGCDTEKGSSGPPSLTKHDEINKGAAEYKGIKGYLGLLLTILGSFCFSLVVLFVKVLKDYGFDGYGASFWRYTGTLIPTIPMLLFYECGPGVKKQDSVFSSVWPINKNENWKTGILLVSRGLLGSTSAILRYSALKYLTIGDTSVIIFSKPVLVTIMAHFLLGERCGMFQLIVAFVMLCGVVIVTKPPVLTGESGFDSDMLIGTGLAVGALVCAALNVIVTRKVRAVHFTLMTLVFGIIGVAQALILIYFFSDFKLPTEIFDSLLLAGVSGLSFVGQMSVVLALKFEQAGPVSLIRYCDVLFGFLLQYVFLAVSPDMFSAIGGVIVLLGMLSVGFRKWLNTLPADDSRRKRWWFVLK